MSNGVTAWSYSRYADYQQCPLKFKLKHIDKLKEPGSPAMQRGSDIHKKGELYLTATGKPKLPEEYKHFASEMAQLRKLDPLVEQQWGFTSSWQPASGDGRDPHGWFANDTYLRIVTDVSVVYDDTTADIIDFKTGKMYATNQDQMDLFSTGPFMKFTKLELVTTRLWYLDIPDTTGQGENTVVQEFTRDDFERIKKEWAKRIRPMFMDKKFPPKPNDKCRWCHFRKENGGPCKY